jgi:hypothetical protein
MKRIHKVNYAGIFGAKFETKTIDTGFSKLGLDEQLRLFD